ncbi:MAG: hypothetical protein L6R43_00525 [Planctomycetes bacterium]|nr:hypothetical protein [Planctomycetota bacterium]
MKDPYARALVADWPSADAGYRAVLAKACRVSPADIEPSEEMNVSIRKEGSHAIIVDLPRMRVRREKPKQVDARICVTLCSGDYRGKLWARVGGRDLPGDGFESVVGGLQSTIEQYRGAARDTIAWYLPRMTKVFSSVEGSVKVDTQFPVEVVTIATRDPALREAFTEVLVPGSEPEVVFNDPVAARRIRRYLKEALRGMDPEVAYRNSRGDGYWRRLPATVETTDGYLRALSAVYLTRPERNVLEAVGIAFDDSRRGDLASKSSLKLARLLSANF